MCSLEMYTQTITRSFILCSFSPKAFMNTLLNVITTTIVNSRFTSVLAHSWIISSTSTQNYANGIFTGRAMGYSQRHRISERKSFTCRPFREKKVALNVVFILAHRAHLAKLREFLPDIVHKLARTTAQLDGINIILG